MISMYLVLVWAETEVLDSLTVALGSSEENNVGASRGAHGELIESDALTTSLLDASTGSSSESEGTDGHLRDLKEAVVIGDGSHHGADLALVCLGRVLGRGHGNNFRYRNRWLVDLACASRQYMSRTKSQAHLMHTH